MKGNFFEQFKIYLLNHHSDNLKTFIPYYETLLQAKEDIQDLLKDAEKYYLDIQYEEDDSGGYTCGTFTFYLYTNQEYHWQSCIDYHYKLELRQDERYWGYCQCSPEDNGYNDLYQCCGDGCDWVAPQINLTKIVGVAYNSFDGLQRDMWKLNEKWEDHLKAHNDKVLENRVKEVEERIVKLQLEKERLLNT